MKIEKTNERCVLVLSYNRMYTAENMSLGVLSLSNWTADSLLRIFILNCKRLYLILEMIMMSTLPSLNSDETVQKHRHSI